MFVIVFLHNFTALKSIVRLMIIHFGNPAKKFISSHRHNDAVKKGVWT